jgi:hypothetical protein
MMGPLGCIIPKDKPHVLASPLSATPGGAPTDVPVVVGFNWYTSFDTPKEIDGSFHLPDVSRGEDLGTIRGGHCFCFEPMGAVKLDRVAAQVFYNQGQEGACVGFGNSRAITIHKAMQAEGTGGEEEFFDAFWLYDEARRLEGTYPSGEGSTVHSGAQVLLTKGHRQQLGLEVCTRQPDTSYNYDAPVTPLDGIKAIRWATTLDEVLAALGRPGAQAIPFENSWGTAYPSAETSVVWMPISTFAQLLAEGGEAGVYTEA